jgi:hypothetical protein
MKKAIPDKKMKEEVEYVEEKEGYSAKSARAR